MDVDKLRDSPIGQLVPISGFDQRFNAPYEYSRTFQIRFRQNLRSTRRPIPLLSTLPQSWRAPTKRRPCYGIPGCSRVRRRAEKP